MVDRIRQVLPPPPSGGDIIDWEMLAHSTGWEFPTDYKEFVKLYGGGEIDEYLSVRTPPVDGSSFGDLLEGVDPALPPDCRAELAPSLPADEEPRLLPFGTTATGDVVFWLAEDVQEKWKVVIFRRHAPYGTKRWSIFDGGMADFLWSLLSGSLEPFSQNFSDGEPHTYLSWRDD
ncbi:SMI1/KNR4 family protein [Streptomyces sp. NPDC048251]|uniref:SMI1/KNR4 family protein n=1 Tax=Streptomyces sp. NPDC048251 TaxID=3154501 RepID=UPI00341272CB